MTEADDFFDRCCGICRYFLLVPKDMNYGTCTEPTNDYLKTEYFAGNQCWKFKPKPNQAEHPLSK